MKLPFKKLTKNQGSNAATEDTSEICDSYLDEDQDVCGLSDIYAPEKAGKSAECDVLCPVIIQFSYMLD